MTYAVRKLRWLLAPLLLAVSLVVGIWSFGESKEAQAEKPKEQESSYLQVKITEPFAATMARMKAEKAEVMARHQALLEKRYDLSDRPAVSRRARQIL